MTMRTFHTGGVAGSDITQGLPRVEELFEARKPKGLAQISETEGTVVSIKSNAENKTEITVRGEEEKIYEIPYGARIAVNEGEYVEAGDNITKGPLDPKDILRLKGVEGVYQYLLKEVQRVYKNQGVDINDKHIEVIVGQMLSKMKVNYSGDTGLLPGGQYGKFEVEEANQAAVDEDKEPADAERLLLGITKASLATNSFLSAASFQETTRVLTDAAIKGKTDYLEGLKENVIIGKLIPAGTGMRKYRNIELDYGVNASLIENYRQALAEMEEDDDDDDESETSKVTEVDSENDIDIEIAREYADSSEFVNEVDITVSETE